MNGVGKLLRICLRISAATVYNRVEKSRSVFNYFYYRPTMFASIWSEVNFS